MPDYKKKAMLYRLEKLVNKKKKELAEEYESKNKIEKDNEKFLLGNKRKESEEKTEKKEKKKDKYKKDKDKKDKKDKKENKNKEKLNNADFKKQKRLETYGITE